MVEALNLTSDTLLDDDDDDDRSCIPHNFSPLWFILLLNKHSTTKLRSNSSVNAVHVNWVPEEMKRRVLRLRMEKTVCRNG